MIYDVFTLAACAAEMRSSLHGLIVHQVRQPDDLAISLICRAGSRESHLFLSADARFARAHLSTLRLPGPQSPPSFCQLLRKHLKGTRVADVTQVGFDRILRLDFQSPGGEHSALIHEIMGRHSNIILVNSEGTVMGAIKVVGRSISRARQIIPGRPYQPPPAPKVDPRTVARTQFVSMRQQAPEQDEARWLTGTFAGISPTLAKEVVFRAQPGGAPALFQSMSDLLGAFERQEFRPMLLRLPGKPHEEVYPLPLMQFPAGCQHPRSSTSEALEATARAEIALSRLEGARTEILKLIARGLDRISRESADLLTVLDKPNLADDLRRLGQTLTVGYRDIPHGGATVSLPDIFDPDMKPVSIELVPWLSPSDNVQRYFRLAAKAEERAKSARQRLPQISANTDRLERAAEEATEASSVDELHALRTALETARLIHAAPAQVRERPEDRPYAGHRVRTTTSVDGLEILRGETAEANDYLTTRVARPNDVWLHARGVTGAHVVVRSGGSSLPPSTLNEAARIAADNSDAKHSSYVPVDWTLRKFVRKPRKSAPGIVTYTHEKTIHVTR